MANIKSQIKRIKQTKVATERNKGARTFLKTITNNLNEAIEKKDKKKATELLKGATIEFDKAAAKGLIHSNRAAGKKSSFTKRVNTIK